MTAYLDANIIIYLVENHPVWGRRVSARIQQLQAAGDGIASGDASRLECLVGPYRNGDATALAGYAAFFGARDVAMFPVTAAVCERAAVLRAMLNVKPLDALHLATAIEHGCGLFLTKDTQLQQCIQITVEILT